MALADRCYNTYRCVVKGEYVDPSEMISFDSDGIESIPALRSELCRIPRKNNGNGLQQIMNKQEMKRSQERLLTMARHTLYNSAIV